MGTVYDAIDTRLRAFIDAQRMFFVATAPSGPQGHVNVSPKGGSGCLVVLERRRIAYLDYTGSGAETIAHLRENGRITLMFCSFEGPPKIVRLHGRGRVLLPNEPEFGSLLHSFPEPAPGLRSIIDVAVTRISDSCGYQVPMMEYLGDRNLLTRWTQRRSDEQLQEYRCTRNAHSIDGLPALARTHDVGAA